MLQRIRNVEKHRTVYELPVQEEIIKTLEEHLKFNQVSHDLTKDYKLYNSALREVYQDLLRIGVIPAMRIAKKS